MDTTTRPTFGDLLRSRRHDRGWTQTDLAAAAGITQSRISSMEQGHIVPTIPTVAALCEALDVGDDELARWIKAVAA